MVPYVVNVVTVMHVCVLRECESARMAAMLVWGPGGGVWMW